MGEQFAEGVADVHDVDVGGVDTRRVERIVDDFAGQVREPESFSMEVVREITLISAENPHVRRAHVRHGTTTNGVTVRKGDGPAGCRSEPTEPDKGDGRPSHLSQGCIAHAAAPQTPIGCTPRAAWGILGI